MTSAATREAVNHYNRVRGRLAGQSGKRLPGDPAMDRTRAELVAAQQRAAVSVFLDAVDARNAGVPSEDWVPALKVPGVPLGVLLLEGIELLAYLVRLSDRPAEMAAALRDATTRG